MAMISSWLSELIMQKIATTFLSSYQNIIVIFGLIRKTFCFTFLFFYINWLIMNIVQATNESLKTSIEPIIKNS